MTKVLTQKQTTTNDRGFNLVANYNWIRNPKLKKGSEQTSLRTKL